MTITTPTTPPIPATSTNWRALWPSISFASYKLAKKRGIRLKCPTGGNESDRFLGAMADHTQLRTHEGAKHAAHVCSTCTLVTPVPDSSNSQSKHNQWPQPSFLLIILLTILSPHTPLVLRAVVTNGVTVGYWRCSASEEQLDMLDPGRPPVVCEESLEKTTHRYCSKQTSLLQGICQ